ncbi:phosphoethanolamine transferase [Croceitalea sp. MTPC9]|uniref:phosphoethanolamine transferase n=2 Tax=unclassified Croceitalea TaxID=2632280 RepID=UPI0030D724A0
MGFFIDNELSDSFSLLANLMWMLGFTIPFAIFQKKWIYKIALWAYFLIGFIEIGHWITMKGPLTFTSLIIILNTNYEEAVSFLELKSTWGLIVLIIYSAIFIFALRISPKKKKVKNKLIHIGSVVIIFGVVVVSLISTIPKYRFLPQVAKMSYTFINNFSDYKKTGEENKLQIVDATFPQNQDQQHTFVLIIGESCSRNHMSLYGANINTNPRLRNRKDIIKYSDIVSGYNYTFQSVSAMLSQSSLENELDITESIDILDVFHSSGFETFWISNQSPIGFVDNVISGIARKSDYSKFVNANGNSTAESFFARAYDEDLFESFESVLKNKRGKNKFIVLHLMGSHYTYNKRYPSNFNHFKGENSKREKLIAEYRNSILYNDFVVDTILTILDKYTLSEEGDVSSAIYLSDHGENVYDEMNKIGHDFSKEMPKVLVEIPFIVWLSPNYLKNNKNKVATIFANKDRPYVTDDLFHSMIDISNIKSPLLEETKSVFNKNFNYNRKRILIDGKDYDRNNFLALTKR